MTTVSELHRAVQTAITGKRIGKPVFVRYLLQGVLETEGPPLWALARTIAVVGEWLGQSPHKLYSLYSGKGSKSQVTFTLLFPDGATAVISEARGQEGNAGVDLTVIGNRGALYHHYDAGGLHAWEDSPASLGVRRIEEILPALVANQNNGTNPIAVELPPAPELLPRPDPLPPRKADPKYGVLLVSGSHTHQEGYAEAFAADPRCKLIAVTDESDVDANRRKLNEQLAWALNVPYLPDLAKALARPDVHIVSICAPPERRGRIAVQCAQAGKHLYLDKSLAPKLAEAYAIAAAVQKAGVKSHMFSMIPQPWSQEAKRLLTDGKLGKLLAIHADAFFAKGKTGTAKPGTPRKEEYPPERQQLVEAKREFDNVAVYPLALIRWLTGKKFQSVHGVTGNYFFQEHQKHNVEDFGLLSGRLEDGLPVTVSAGRFGWTTHPNIGVNRIVLVGSARTAIVDANRPRLEISNDETPWMPPAANPLDPMAFWKSTTEAVHARPKTAWAPIGPPPVNDSSYFIDCLEAGRDSDLNAAEAALTTEVLLATYQSAATDAVVKLPLGR